MAVTAAAPRAGSQRWAGVAAWALWALALLGLATVPWFDHLTRQAGRPELTQLNASTIPYLVAIVVAATVGAVLASRLPRHPVGWLLLALGLSVTGSALTGVGAAVVGVGMAMGAMAVPLFAAGVCLVLLPLATGAAILRYRLYDLDRIISRTLAYGLLTVVLGGSYAVVVLGLGELIGRDSSLAVAAATLAVAAAFQPARRRVQAAVDRRFNRRRYDAAQTIAAFGDRLRQQVDLDTLTAELLAVVDQTIQPTNVSLWLRDSVGALPIHRNTGAARAAR